MLATKSMLFIKIWLAFSFLNIMCFCTLKIETSFIFFCLIFKGQFSKPEIVLSGVKVINSTKVYFHIWMTTLTIDISICLLIMTKNRKILKVAEITDLLKGYFVRLSQKKERKNLKWDNKLFTYMLIRASCNVLWTYLIFIMPIYMSSFKKIKSIN